MTNSPFVDVDITDDIATITLLKSDRANALDAALVDDVIDALDRVEDARSRILVIRSSSPRFCSGFDLHAVADSSSAELAWRFLRIGLLLERVQTLPALTVAVLEGAAVGAGADLAAACDVRIATDTATLRFPGSAFNLVLGTRRLAALVGDGHAVRLAATGEKVLAEEAHRTGLVDLLVPASRLEDEIRQLADTARRRTPSTLGALTTAVRPADPAGLADLARSLATQPDLTDAMSQFALRGRARTTTPEQEPA